MTVADELRTLDLFDGLSDEELAEWAAVTPEIATAAPGDAMLEQGSSPGPLLLFEGTTRQYVTSNGHTDPANANHGPTWIGAIAAITESPVPLTVEADTECRFAIIPRDAFIDLTLKHRSVHRKVMSVIGPVMRGMNQRESSRSG